MLLILGVVSVDEIKSFKPNPGVYCHFLRRAGATGADAWLISSTLFKCHAADPSCYDPA